MAGIVRCDCDGYRSDHKCFNVSEIANKVKSVPRNYINERGNYITDEGLAYLRPLIIGECNITYKDGIPQHYIFPKI